MRHTPSGSRLHTANQRLHQMPSGMVWHMLTYKAERLGMQVVLVDERYTTRTCPASGHRYKPTGRMYRCRHCGFVFHRDGVGEESSVNYTCTCSPNTSGEAVIRMSPRGTQELSKGLAVSAHWWASPRETGQWS